MKPQIISPPASPKPVGPYSHAVRVGDLLFCSGQIPLNAATGQIDGADIQTQTRRVLENVRVLLESEGLGTQNVFKTTVYMTDLADFGPMNEIYGQYFSSDFPARSTVQVSGLPRGAQVEIEVIAHYSTP
jgi:2-iminobutanoate/2-iminopropanoate deaminase